MSLLRLRQFLDSYNIKYVIISHSVAYTAETIAALTHIPGKEVAKTVIVKINDTGDGGRVCLPARGSGAFEGGDESPGCAIAAEHDFRGRFPDCETGAMPPFGNLYGMKVFADETLSRDKEIVFNAGSHRELVRLTWEDFQRMVEPELLKLAKVKSAAEAA
jgi:Ala-tRNA(Pro) deacylase